VGCVERVITVATPREKVWRFLADFTTTEEWDPPTLLTERTSGDGGVGTTYRNVASLHGERTEFDYVVTEYVEHERLRLEGRSRLVRLVDTITLVEAPGGGTTVTFRAEVDAEGPAPDLTQLGDYVADSLQDSLEHL
jgi:uncharacterized protein YndB with AHSA1/START domain